MNLWDKVRREKQEADAAAETAAADALVNDPSWGRNRLEDEGNRIQRTRAQGRESDLRNAIARNPEKIQTDGDARVFLQDFSDVHYRWQIVHDARRARSTPSPEDHGNDPGLIRQPTRI